MSAQGRRHWVGREAGVPLLLTVVRGQQHFPKVIPTSALNPSD